MKVFTPDFGHRRVLDGLPSLVLKDVGKRFSSGQTTTTALENVSLNIWPGTLTALIGPSGSGKTTALSIMGGLLRPSSGQALVYNHDLAVLSERERSRIRLNKIGFVFQLYNLFPTLTARRNLELVLELKGVVGRERRVQAEALLEDVGLGDKANAYPADLSGGQKQRVAIARALAGAPQIILADEPTAALDSANGRKIVEALRDCVVRHQRTVVIVTHDNRVVDLADRIIRIEDGKVIDDTMLLPAERHVPRVAHLVRRLPLPERVDH